MRRFLCLGWIVLLAACGGAETDVPIEDSDVIDDAWYRFLADGARIPVETDGDAGAPCSGPGGCLGDPCADGGDCGSGWCVLHRGESVCTKECGGCPGGWTCRTVGAGTTGAIDLCLSDHPTLCLPCVAPSDCLSAGSLQDHCVTFGAEGSFCGGDCDGGCPPGNSCATVSTVDGFEVDQCVPDAGLCECPPHAVAEGLWTLCQVTNGWGACPGKRTCTETGLSACEGPVPSIDVCDGDDNDCDGAVDEETCDDHDDCTEDSCGGMAGCVHLPLDGGECGGICIAGGICVEGECVGQSVMNCDDSNPCTEDFCDPQMGCGSEPGTGDCDDGDPCTAADHCEGGVCVGILQDPCDPDPCNGAGECVAGATEDEVKPCGNCGTSLRTRVCTEACAWGAWGEWGLCADEGPCTPWDTGAEEAACGMCGSKTRTRSCNDLCQWEAWGAWSACSGQGVCSPGATQDAGCDVCKEKKCNSSCQWGGCQYKPGANCEWQNGTNWKCCAPGKWHFCLPPVYGCVWSSDCEPCTGCGC